MVERSEINTFLAQKKRFRARLSRFITSVAMLSGLKIPDPSYCRSPSNHKARGFRISVEWIALYGIVVAKWRVV